MVGHRLCLSLRPRQIVHKCASTASDHRDVAACAAGGDEVEEVACLVEHAAPVGFRERPKRRDAHHSVAHRPGALKAVDKGTWATLRCRSPPGCDPPHRSRGCDPRGRGSGCRTRAETAPASGHHRRPAARRAGRTAQHPTRCGGRAVAGPSPRRPHAGGAECRQVAGDQVRDRGRGLDRLVQPLLGEREWGGPMVAPRAVGGRMNQRQKELRRPCKRARGAPREAGRPATGQPRRVSGCAWR